MANQLKMAEVQAILALARHGWSRRRIARELGVHRETVGRYVKRPAGEDPKPASNAPPGFFAHQGPSAEGIGSAPGCSEPEGAPLGSGNLAGGSKPANNAPTGFLTNPSGPASAAGPWQEVILQKLQQGLDARRIYQDLAGDHGYGGSYYSVRRLVAKLTAFVDPPVRRMECAPGDEAQVDFGRGAPVVGPDGKRRLTWVFRIVLSHSRKGYSESVFRQTTDDFLRCLENAFQHFGGCPRTLVIDNLKAAVKQPDWFDPELCPKMRSFAEHYGIAILPTRPRTPRHKGKIERGIGYVKNNALKGRTFTSLAEQNRHLAHWEASVADLRIHGTTRQQVIGRFEQFEKPALLPLPPGRFALFAEALRRVNRDGHVQVKSAYYSLPPEYVGQEVWARWDGRLVRLFNRRMQEIATHVQQVPGRFSTLNVHLMPEKISRIERGATWLLDQVDGIGASAKAWAEGMLKSRGIEGMRVLMGLLNLVHHHPRRRIDWACGVALGHEAWHLRNLRQLIERASHDGAEGVAVQEQFDFATEHPIIRPVADYGRWVREALTQGTHEPFTGSLTPQERATCEHR